MWRKACLAVFLCSSIGGELAGATSLGVHVVTHTSSEQGFSRHCVLNIGIQEVTVGHILQLIRLQTPAANPQFFSALRNVIIGTEDRLDERILSRSVEVLSRQSSNVSECSSVPLKEVSETRTPYPQVGNCGEIIALATQINLIELSNPNWNFPDQCVARARSLELVSATGSAPHTWTR